MKGWKRQTTNVKPRMLSRNYLLERNPDCRDSKIVPVNLDLALGDAVA
jgi:hypothetical protein